MPRNPQVGNLSSYYEVVGRFGMRDPLGDVVIVATGFSYQAQKNLQFDAGINVGVTRAADRINPFIAISRGFPGNRLKFALSHAARCIACWRFALVSAYIPRRP